MLLNNIRWRCKKSGIPFDLELADFLPPPAVCPVFGTTLNYGPKERKGYSPDSPSFDRMEPAKGYVKGNVQIISNRANTMKNNGTLEELRAVVAYMERG